MNSLAAFQWTDAAVDRLRALVGQELSAAKIAVQLGCSRNAVIGKVHRMGGKVGALSQPRIGTPAWTPHNKGSGKPRPAKAARPRPTRRARPTARPDAPPAIARAMALVVPPMPFSQAVDKGRCLFFAGDPYGPADAEMPVCGGRRSESAIETRYCTIHIDAARRLRPPPEAPERRPAAGSAWS